MTSLKPYKEMFLALKDAVQNIINDKNIQLSSYQRTYITNLLEDMEFYFNKFQSYSIEYHRGWRHILENRFKYLFEVIDTPAWQGTFSKILWETYLKFSKTYNGDIEKVDSILFSQQECTTNFKLSTNVNAANFPYAGRNIEDIALELKNNPELLENFVIRVYRYFDGTRNWWVTANNRSLAAIYMANLVPVRIRLDTFTIEELLRKDATFISHANQLVIPKDIREKRTTQEYKRVEDGDQTYPFSIIY